MTERTDLDRMKNTGVPVDTKKFGPGGLIVRELYLEELLELTAELVKILQSSLMKLSGDKSEAAIISLLKDPALVEAVRAVLAKATERNKDDFVRMGVTDWLKVIEKFLEVMDWKEIKELFTRVVSPEMQMAVRDYLAQKTQATQ